MSALLEKTRASTRTAKRGESLLVGALPQVNLLPPEVAAARGLQRTKRWLLVSLAATLLACGAAYAVSLFSIGWAQGGLNSAAEETLRLQTEKATYAEVTPVLNSLAQTRLARELGMETEVDWKAYVDAFTAVLPEGVSVEQLKGDLATPMTPVAATGDFLTPVNVGQLEITGRSLVVPDAAAWIDGLNSVPGVVDARVTSVVVQSDEDGTTYYTVTATAHLTEAAYLHRFAAGATEE